MDGVACNPTGYVTSSIAHDYCLNIGKALEKKLSATKRSQNLEINVKGGGWV